MSYDIHPSASVHFKKAPTIAIAGPTGSGKTESAIRLARGYVGKEGKFLVIDTEEKRALYKRARYQPWDWMDLQPPFSPESYRKALDAGRGYDAVILDSGSHEYAGPGGLQDMQAEDLERMSKGDASKMERLTAPAWKRAKLEHKRLMSSLIRYPTLLIVCLRAEPKIRFVKVDADGNPLPKGAKGGKTVIEDAGYQPICEKMFGYEMLVFCMMNAEQAGVPQHIKKLEPELETVFVTGEQITEQTGERLASWASTRERATQQPTATEPTKGPEQVVGCISVDEAIVLEDALHAKGKTNARLLANVSRQYGFKVERLAQIRKEDYEAALEYANK